MPIHGKTASGWKLSTPWTKRAGGWGAPVKVFSKTGVSTWTEVWPLLPGTPSGLALSLLYRNDRIEADFSWVAPVSGVAVHHYNVTVYINGGVYNVYNIAAPTVSMTLTNGGSGFQNVAGGSMYFTVQAVTAAGVAGTTVQSASQTVPQLPAPPAAVITAVSLDNGDVTYTWTHSGGNRLTGFQVDIFGPVGAATYYYGAATSSTSSAHPWVGANVNGGAFLIAIYATGPGGAASPATFNGTIPGDVAFNNTRMFTAAPGVGVSQLQADGVKGSNSDGYTLYWNEEGGGNNLYGNITSDGQIYLGPGTIGTDLARFRWVGVPYNSLGSGRICVSPWVRRIANPLIITPDDGDTFFNGSWYGGGLIEQGRDAATNTDYYGYAFYGDHIYQAANDIYLGYRITVVHGYLAMSRNTGGGPGGVNPWLYLHTAGSRAEATNIFDGGYGLPGMFILSEATPEIPGNWVRYLFDHANQPPWKGFGFYVSDWSGNQNARFNNNYSSTVNTPWGIYPATTLIVVHDG